MSTNTKHQELIEAYAQQCAEDADLDALIDYMAEGIVIRLQDLVESEALEEIEDYYPDLLKQLEDKENENI